VGFKGKKREAGEGSFVLQERNPQGKTQKKKKKKTCWARITKEKRCVTGDFPATKRERMVGTISGRPRSLKKKKEGGQGRKFVSCLSKTRRSRRKGGLKWRK